MFMNDNSGSVSVRGGVVVNALNPHVRGPWIETHLGQGYALLMSPNKGETRVWCFPFGLIQPGKSFVDALE